MAKGLRSMLLLSALAWMVVGTEAQDTFDDFKWTHVAYPGPNSHDRDFCNRIMKERGLDDEMNTFVIAPDDLVIKMCRSPEGEELTMKKKSSLDKVPLVMCRSRDEDDSDSTGSNYSTVKINERILVKCQDGMPIGFLGPRHGGTGQ